MKWKAPRGAGGDDPIVVLAWLRERITTRELGHPEHGFNASALLLATLDAARPEAAMRMAVAVCARAAAREGASPRARLVVAAHEARLAGEAGAKVPPSPKPEGYQGLELGNAQRAQVGTYVQQAIYHLTWATSLDDLRPLPALDAAVRTAWWTPVCDRADELRRTGDRVAHALAELDQATRVDVVPWAGRSGSTTLSLRASRDDALGPRQV